jgi:hypothetical protein
MAIGLHLNVMYAVYALSYFGMVIVFDREYRSSWRRWGMALLLFLVLASPTVIHTLSAISQSNQQTELWLKLAQARFAHHLFPLDWSLGSWLRWCGFGVVAIGLAAWWRRQYEQIYRHLLLWTATAVLWVGLAFGAAYVVRSPALLVMHPGRATDLWVVYAAIAVTSLLTSAFEQQSERRRIQLVGLLWCASVVMWSLSSSPSIALICVVTLIMMAMAIGTVWPTAQPAARKHRAAGLLIVAVIGIAIERAAERVSRSGNLGAAWIENPASHLDPIAEWADRHTSSADTFLVKPGWSLFRAIVQRPVFVGVKDGSAILWHRPFAAEWHERISALGYGLDESEAGFEAMKRQLDHRFENLSDQGVLDLAGRYRIDYWVTGPDKPSSFPVAFQSPAYTVYEIPSPTSTL